MHLVFVLYLPMMKSSQCEVVNKPGNNERRPLIYQNVNPCPFVSHPLTSIVTFFQFISGVEAAETESMPRKRQAGLQPCTPSIRRVVHVDLHRLIMERNKKGGLK